MLVCKSSHMYTRLLRLKIICHSIYCYNLLVTVWNVTWRHQTLNILSQHNAMFTAILVFNCMDNGPHTFNITKCAALIYNYINVIIPGYRLQSDSYKYYVCILVLAKESTYSRTRAYTIYHV